MPERTGCSGYRVMDRSSAHFRYAFSATLLSREQGQARHEGNHGGCYFKLGRGEHGRGSASSFRGVRKEIEGHGTEWQAIWTSGKGRKVALVEVQALVEVSATAPRPQYGLACWRARYSIAGNETFVVIILLSSVLPAT